MRSEGSRLAPDWSPHDRHLLYTKQSATTQRDLWTLSLTGDRQQSVFLDSPELFFLAPDGAMMAAGIRVVNGGVEATVPQRLFVTGLGSTIHDLPYAVAGGGQRFLIPVAVGPPGAAPINVVMDWPARLPK